MGDKPFKPSPAPHLNLPPGFLWGTSTSSYQIEGAANEDGRLPSIWDTHCKLTGNVSHGDTGEVACDHYHRYPEDIKLMTELGLKAYRFSLSWSRVLPRGRGAINPKGLDFYDKLIDGLLEVGIDPWICLFHWDFPQLLQDLGGWSNRDSVGWFADYALVAARRYGDRVKHWATFNEQNMSTLFGYVWGTSPPGASDRAGYFRVAHHENLAHGAAIDVLRGTVSNASLGIVHNRQAIFPEHDDPAHRAVVALMDTHWNTLFPDPQILGHYPESVVHDVEPFVQSGDLSRICRPLDWFGLNHYGPTFAKVDPTSTLGFQMGAFPEGMAHTEINWPVCPETFKQELLKLTRRYHLPIYITENGCGSNQEVPDKTGFVQDDHRINYLTLHTGKMAEAIREGSDIRGYFVWSLLDNFEWNSGYDDRFGIVRVDFDTLKRTPKASAKWYANLISKN